ncbi:ATP-binding protein [Paraburkholderia guartelaensis]|uniref:ATP-binding protein n=1 Tax=Paraburkholderia guartelaensis TaxID=2546446 RepID=UPI002AB621C3|nr:ATP-binding protein [Paraburkholderia guartelaensis]
MKHYIYTVRSDKDGFATIADLSAAAADLECGELVVDFSSCVFFDANMTAPLNAALKRIENESNTVKITGLRDDVERILRKNHFLGEYGYDDLHDTNQTTLPHECFGLSQSKEFSGYLDRHLARKEIPKMSDGLVRRFRQSILEMFQNCATHSSTKSGVFVCGQFYPHNNRLKLTISDGGIGIRTNVRRVAGGKISSVDAIKWALQEGNTTKTGNEPGGFGLKLLQEFVELNQGKVQIVSRYGYYEFDGKRQKFEKMDGDLRGTTVNLEINTNDKRSYALKSELASKDIF